VAARLIKARVPGHAVAGLQDEKVRRLTADDFIAFVDIKGGHDTAPAQRRNLATAMRTTRRMAIRVMSMKGMSMTRSMSMQGHVHDKGHEHDKDDGAR